MDLVKALDVRDGDAVLDVGCGTGTVLSYLRENRKIIGYGLDISENMIAIAKEKNPGFSLTTGNSAKLPYADETMDVMMACMAYHHFPDQVTFRNHSSGQCRTKHRGTVHRGTDHLCAVQRARPSCALPIWTNNRRTKNNQNVYCALGYFRLQSVVDNLNPEGDRL